MGNERNFELDLLEAKLMQTDRDVIHLREQLVNKHLEYVDLLCQIKQAEREAKS